MVGWEGVGGGVGGWGGSIIGERLAKALECYKFLEIGLVACRVSNEYSDDRYNRTR